MFNFLKKEKPPKQFPPVPKWRPEVYQPIERIITHMQYYSNGTRDFAVFKHGTSVLLTENLNDEAAAVEAKAILEKIYHAHPDMLPMNMDDGHVVVKYNLPAYNVVLSDVAQSHWDMIERHHLEALAAHEVLITPAGPNKFDELGKKGLFGRCFMFMDAQTPEVIRIIRKNSA